MTTTTTPTRPLLIVGRGHGAYEFTDWDSGDIMAVSSGIFALPEGVIPQHFVTLDEASYFTSPINDHAIAWHRDTKARQWPFWSDENITKHVTVINSQPGDYHPFPMAKVLEALGAARNPELVRAKLLAHFEWIQTHYGHRPNWGDYSSVRPWRVVVASPPNFLDLDAPIGLASMRNSVFMALQIATRLGYRDIRLVGIFDGEGYEQHQEVLSQWHAIATFHGIQLHHIRTAIPQLETAA
jgi:hypothetical protein